MIEMHDAALEIVGPERAALAAGLPVRTEHEVIDDELALAAEQVREGRLAVLAVEHVSRLDLFPRQLAPLGAQRIARVGESFSFSRSRSRAAVQSGFETI